MELNLVLSLLKASTLAFLFFYFLIEIANNGNIMETNKKEKEKTNHSFLPK